MKFRKFGKALLMTAISAGVVFGISSCVQSYTVGFLYVTGNQTSGTTGQGVISGFKIDHNTGKLTPINGLPVASGGANPGRAVLLTGGRFLYVLNRGVSKDGAPCSPADPCQANITQFAIGGNGILSFQQTYFTQGLNPFRILADSSGAHLYVLDHDVPDDASCSLVFGPNVTSCGDITVFSVDATTGRLSYVLNSQVTAASGSPLPYFPVPADPIDMVQSASFMLTMSGTPATGDSVFPYGISSTGQLTITQNSSQPLGVSQANAIVVAAPSTVYVLDNGLNTNSPATRGQIFAYTVGSNGALLAQTNGYYALDPTLSNPNYVIASNNGKWLYVLAEGDNQNTTVTQSGIAAYTITQPFQLTPIANGGQTPGTEAGPQCILEDPSNQFVYTANFNSSNISGHSIDQNAGNLRPLSQQTKAADHYALPGPAAWCMVTGRTS
jgi:6-phosphogluconolactonase (cycloisomerase 2 family)